MTETPPRRVVVCADDFGLTQQASHAIVELMSVGAITAASCVVDGLYCKRWAGELLKAAHGRSLGLHFNLTERPGHPRRRLEAWLFMTYGARRLKRGDLDAEMERQLRLFEDMFGRRPDFVDGHEHVHQLPLMRDLLVRRMRQSYGDSVAIRSTVARRWRGVKAFVIERLGGRALSRLADSGGLARNLDFAGVYDFSTARPYGERMERWLQDIEDGGLVMCHPEAAVPVRPSSNARLVEHQFLASPAWPALCARYSIQLVPFTASAMSRAGHAATRPCEAGFR